MKTSILIVDDSRMSRMILRNFLVTLNPDLEIHEAGDGMQALELARATRLDVVSMDLNMPGMDGVEAALKIRELHPQLPIALLTANVQAAVQSRAAASGLQFLAKPIGPDTAAQVLALVGGSSHA